MTAIRYLVNDVDASLPFYAALGFKLADRWGPPFAIVKRKSQSLWLDGPGTSARKRLSDRSVPAVPAEGGARVNVTCEHSFSARGGTGEHKPAGDPSMKVFLALVALMASFACSAETTPVATPGAAPYAGQESRDIKALSPDDVQAYLAGKGMGFAKAAELNGYPGPSHVLALSSQLGLTPEQQRQTRSLFEAMEAKAMRAGAPLVDEERKLDRLFATKAITPDLLSAALAHISELQAQVRAAHLEAHLAQLRILTPEQVALYMQLRGYTSGEPATKHEHHQHAGG